jgi:hypothetical protein
MRNDLKNGAETKCEFGRYACLVPMNFNRRFVFGAHENDGSKTATRRSSSNCVQLHRRDMTTNEEFYIFKISILFSDRISFLYNRENWGDL